jgi:hypothetical protein
MLPDKRESSDDCVGPGKVSRVSLFITGTDTGVGKTQARANFGSKRTASLRYFCAPRALSGVSAVFKL